MELHLIQKLQTVQKISSLKDNIKEMFKKFKPNSHLPSYFVFFHFVTIPCYFQDHWNSAALTVFKNHTEQKLTWQPYINLKVKIFGLFSWVRNKEIRKDLSDYTAGRCLVQSQTRQICHCERKTSNYYFNYGLEGGVEKVEANTQQVTQPSK